ncbi:pyridoxamine 5'-phosphate oxidase family protein [Anaerobaca lacustris]|uniref:Pyridoxamine 5'-phosphate oxidase family protein n=1 Tax=Anaerobaca lacustris TaxID=3044600 RepID=A0AAW6U3A6_9BACT|nr:pyridoxamine 5'-phosphate oxidase family protein [Sedimentisphaerales bacterium M17dextr]
MDDLTRRIAAILRQPQLAGLATITEDGKPWVRYVMTVASRDMVIRCATFVEARKVRQIEKNPEVHLTCGVTDPHEMVPYLQIQGRARLDTSREARHGFWTSMLAKIFDGPDDPKYGVLEITPYRIEYCDVAAPEPQVWTAG